MKKNIDEIDSLLNAYKKTSAVRIASEKKRIALLKAEEKAREKFIAAAIDIIIHTVRPVMKNLLKRLSKNDFMVSITHNSDATPFTENYIIDSIEEEELRLRIDFHVDDEKERIAFICQYRNSVDGLQVGSQFNELYLLNEINEVLIQKLFIEGLKKICL